MLVGMSPGSSSMYVIEPGYFESIRRAAGRTSPTISENARDDITMRVVSTGRETAAEGMPVSQRKRSGVVGFCSSS